MECGTVSKQTHHERQELCVNRPKYRQGRKLTAVKVFSVCDESRYLLIHRVPAIAVTAELETLCLTFGSIEHLKLIPDYPSEKFCEVYQVKFHTIQSARFAKRKMDDKSFYGGTLHVCYAPELETIDDTRNKLISRRLEILNKLQPTRQCPKRKHSDDCLPVIERAQPVVEDPISCHLDSIVSKGHDEDVCSTKSKASKQQQRSLSEPSTSAPPIKRIVYHQPTPKIVKPPSVTTSSVSDHSTS